MADIDDVVNWCPSQVIDWFRGLDDSLQPYIPNFEEANITGAQLLTLNYEDLENLGVVAIGHQVLILDAADLLKQMHYDLESENLQSRALDLNCRCRALRSHISTRGRSDTTGTEAFRQGPSISLLKLSCDVLDSSKLLVMWLDRPPFFSNTELRKVRADIVRLSHELSTTVQQPIFACAIEDAVLAICADMETLSNQMIGSNDVMTIQPAFLEVTHLVNRDPSSGLGLFIKATFEGHHVITGTKEGSISSRIRRIASGDEVVAVGSRNVVGWQLAKLVAALKESQNDISITLKKRPQLTTNSNSLGPLSRRTPKQDRTMTAPPVVQPIQKVVESRKNSEEGSIDSNLDKTHSSKESLNSLKKESKKRKKLKKAKAKSSSNILVNAGDGLKKYPPHHRGSLSQEFPSDKNKLRAASSTEAILSSSTTNLTKNFDLRRSLEKVWKRDRYEVNPKAAKNDVTQSSRRTKSDAHSHPRKGKVPPENMMPNVNDVLEELRMRRLKQSEARNSETKKSHCNVDHQRYASEPSQASPLEFLVIPPPPSAPYLPRVENVLQELVDEDMEPVRERKQEKPPESPNSLLDIEHRRRFTIIGSEQMDEKWYNSLLSEVNSKRAQMMSSVASSKKLLGRLDETTTASEDSVFASQSLVGEEITVVRRTPRPMARHRPMSMPPNYYSAAQLNQYRTGQALVDARQKDSLTKVSDRSSPSTGNVAPIAHQVDANGVKKLAPLNCSIENVNQSRSADNSLDNRGSQHVNLNNNNRSLSERKIYRTPPRPVPRVTPPSTMNDSYGNKEKRSSQSRQDVKYNAPKSPQPHGRTRSPNSPAPDQAVQPYVENRRFVKGRDAQKTRAAKNETKHFFGEPSSSKVYSPSCNGDDSVPRSTAVGTGVLRQRQTPAPVTPPVAKPRHKIKSVDTVPAQSQGRQNRVNSVDTSVLLKSTAKPDQARRRKSESASGDKKMAEKMSLLGLAHAPPASRGSYVAAINGGYSLNDLIKESSSKGKRTETDSEGNVIKVVDGVKVKLRKSPAIARSNSSSSKKARLKIVDQLRGSPDMRSHRRVSCRDLGAGECDGWLWKKKTNATSPLSSKWSKRWVVLKENALYTYHTEEDEKAESYIYLPGYKVTPTVESKKKFAFRVAHPERKTFYFASDRQMDMTRWMNKLGLAAIEYTFTETVNHTPKEENFVSESDSEDTSGAESANSSPEKPLKPQADNPATSTPPRSRGQRHMSTLPDLNRSARYPKNKAEQLKSSAATQVADATPEKARNRSKSESNRPRSSAVHETQGGGIDPKLDVSRNTPAHVKNGKQWNDDMKRKQNVNRSSDPNELVAGHTNSGDVMAAVKPRADKKQDVEERQSAAEPETLSTNRRQESKSIMASPGKEMENHAKSSSRLRDSDDSQSDAGTARQDIIVRPKAKSEAAQRPLVEKPPSAKKGSSIGDLYKELQHADVDFRGVNRRTTLRRKMTILSRDPKKNDLMLRKRALQRQIKAKEGELEYFKQLDDKVITSDVIHDWINQHQSYFTELGTIRRLSQKRKNANKPPAKVEMESEENRSCEEVFTPSTTANASIVTPPVPAKRTSLLLSESPHENELSPIDSLHKEARVRPRSWAISASDSDAVKARSARSTSPRPQSSAQNAHSELDKSYLETDL